MSHFQCFISGYEAFCVCLIRGIYAQRNLCDKQNVLFYGTPVCYEKKLKTINLPRINFIIFRISRW